MTINISRELLERRSYLNLQSLECLLLRSAQWLRPTAQHHIIFLWDSQAFAEMG